jgi:N-acyl-D-amino-acid deacylase
MGADLVIKGGTVVDGTGAPRRRADVAVTGGMISDIGEGLAGSHVLDASGHVVAPGFVDIHTHYDAQVFWDPALTPSSWHGVTTVVAGNCGFSLAPCRPEHRDLLVRTLEHVEDMDRDTLEQGIAWDFESFPEYLDAVERHGTVINFAAYIGHTAVRLYVMGDDGYERQHATDDELDRMADVVRSAVRAGAAGFASSSSATHSGDQGRPVPSRLADMRELAAVLSPLRELGRGVVELLPGERITHADVYRLQRMIERPITWTALLTLAGHPYHQTMAAQNDTERARGADVWPQVSVRPLVFQMNLSDPFPFLTAPAFAELTERSIEEKMAAYCDPEWRTRAARDVADRVYPPPGPAYGVAESRAHPELVGRPLDELAAERGGTPLDVMLALSCEERLTTRFSAVLANDDEEGIAWLLQQDGMLIGLSDAGAHISQLCDACMPTDLLGRWVRDKGVLSLEAAIRKLTGEPADVYALDRRGYVRAGALADLVVFDPDTVAPGPLRRVHDFPANGERLVADQPHGMAHVLVRGTPIRLDGEHHHAGIAARPGTVLRA